jgi:hypothetical protein
MESYGILRPLRANYKKNTRDKNLSASLKGPRQPWSTRFERSSLTLLVEIKAGTMSPTLVIPIAPLGPGLMLGLTDSTRHIVVGHRWPLHAVTYLPFARPC